MPTQLIRLRDGILVEAEVPENQAEAISSSNIKGVHSTFNKIKPMLLGVSRPMVEVWKELNKDMEVEQAEVNIGFSFKG